MCLFSILIIGFASLNRVSWNIRCHLQDLFLSLRTLTGICLASTVNDLPICFSFRVSELWYIVYLVPQKNADYLQEAFNIKKMVFIQWLLSFRWTCIIKLYSKCSLGSKNRVPMVTNFNHCVLSLDKNLPCVNSLKYNYLLSL